MTPSPASVARALEDRWKHVARTEAIAGQLNRAWDQLADAAIRAMQPALDAARKETWEAAAKIAEEGRFLHDDAPDAQFGKACATAIRRAAALREERSDT